MTDNTDEWLASLEDGSAEARDASDLRAVGEALIGIEAAEANLRFAVANARALDRSWTEIANVLGVSRQAARQRFGDTAPRARETQPTAAPLHVPVTYAKVGDLGDGAVLMIGSPQDFAASLAKADFVYKHTSATDVEEWLAQVTAESSST